MRVLHVTHAYPPAMGGAEIYGQRVSEGMAALGHDVAVATSDLEDAEGFYRLGVGEMGPRYEVVQGVAVHRLSTRGPAYEVASGLGVRRASGKLTMSILRSMQGRFRRRLARLIADYEPDSVLALPHLFTNVRAAIAARDDIGFPLVMVPLLHENDPHWPFDEMRQVLADVDGVVALTYHEAARLRDGYDVPPERIFVCPPGVDVPDSRPPTDREGVLYLGRKVPGKGIERLIAAMHRVWTTRPGVTLTLAGRADPAGAASWVHDIAPEWRSLLIELDDVSEKEKDELLRSAAVVVSPSANESYGIVLLEAMARGAAVVAVDTPITREVVGKGARGILAANDEAAIAKAIGRLLENPETATRIGTEGRTWVASNRTWDHTAEGIAAAHRFAASTQMDAS